MGTDELAYLILHGLDQKKATQAAEEVINPGKLKADPDKWLEVLRTLQEEGYISGVSIRENIIGEFNVDYGKARITMAGVSYLRENSVMQKIARLLGHVVSAVNVLKP